MTCMARLHHILAMALRIVEAYRSTITLHYVHCDDLARSLGILKRLDELSPIKWRDHMVHDLF